MFDSEIPSGSDYVFHRMLAHISRRETAYRGMADTGRHNRGDSDPDDFLQHPAKPDERAKMVRRRLGRERSGSNETQQR